LTRKNGKTLTHTSIDPEDIAIHIRPLLISGQITLALPLRRKLQSHHRGSESVAQPRAGGTVPQVG
jgi:hypothetical protein